MNISASERRLEEFAEVSLSLLSPWAAMGSDTVPRSLNFIHTGVSVHLARVCFRLDVKAFAIISCLISCLLYLLHCKTPGRVETLAKSTLLMQTDSIFPQKDERAERRIGLTSALMELWWTNTCTRIEIRSCLSICILNITHLVYRKY